MKPGCLTHSEAVAFYTQCEEIRDEKSPWTQEVTQTECTTQRHRVQEIQVPGSEPCPEFRIWTFPNCAEVSWVPG